MSAQIMPFDLAGRDIRFGVAEDGRPFVVASDYTSAMGYGQASDATRLLDEDEAGQQIVLTRSANGVEQRRELNVIYEDGMWELIFRSSLPGAKALKGQVKAILRKIRETGRFEVAPAEMPSYAVALRGWAEQLEAREAAEARAALESRRADAAEAFKGAIEAGDGLSLRAFHKKYFSAVAEHEFFGHLYGRGYLINQRGKGSTREDGSKRDGSQHRHPTAKGKEFFYLHGHGVHGGSRREGSRVRPGELELALKAALIKEGLVANNNDTGQPRTLPATPQQLSLGQGSEKESAA